MGRRGSVGPHDEILGRRVKVKFDNGEWFCGVVTEYCNWDKKYPTYAIRYDDGQSMEHSYDHARQRCDRRDIIFLPDKQGSEGEIKVKKADEKPERDTQVICGSVTNTKAPAVNTKAPAGKRKRENHEPGKGLAAFHQPGVLAFQVGARVQARFDDDPSYYPGIITKVNPTGTYAISFEDGDKDDYVPQKDIQLALAQKENPSGAKKTQLKAKLKAKLKTSSGWVDATALPKNWKMKCVRRSSGVKNNQQSDKHYMSPSGEKFNSLTQVQTFLDGAPSPTKGDGEKYTGLIP